MQAKAPAPPGPGLYPSGPFQPIPPVGSYQPSPELSSYPSALGQPLLSRPLVGGHPSYTPPLSASPGPRLPPAQATPPPPAVTSASYYPNPPQPMAPAWHYNAAATPMGPASSMSTPPRGPVANHVNPTVSLAAPSPPPHMSHSTAQPSGPGLVRLSLAHLGGTWATTPPSPLGTRTPQPLLHPPPFTQQFKLPPILSLKELRHTNRVFRCTLTSIPQTQSLLNKAKLPLGLLLHPFKDLSLRPPQPAVYLFVLDVSHNAVETGYLSVFCQSLLDNINAYDLLKSLPNLFEKTMETQSALGSALQAAFKLLSPSGGRMSVFQTQLPNLGVGALQSREDPNQRASAKVETQVMGFFPERYSAGSVYYYPSYHHQHNPAQVERFQKDLKRYLTRKIGFEAVMRIRCTKGLSIHTFHGNFFVRSTDLLSLPNVNPDAGFAVQMSIEENLDDMQIVSFQAALLYTSSKGERRIRVHTMCLPVVNSLSDVFAGADVQAITGLLACMGTYCSKLQRHPVDRSVTASLSDARDAMTNAAIDSLSSYRQSALTIQQPGLLAPACLRLFPLYVLALLKQVQTGTSTRLDDRVFAMYQLKYQPLAFALLMIHPALYRVDDLNDEGALNINDQTIPQPRVLQLSVEKLSREGAFLMDAGIVQLDTAESQRTRAFIGWLRDQRPFFPSLHIIRWERKFFALNCLRAKETTCL
ncbi:hypothetical protein XENOCAPTIV_017593 [Xenoophorus captivus]|uniref:Uncharacterized protein n=1 Tax=Xenoophorus captivus TaxID=1517983 RepID=A0ABV0RL00_9TELE